MTLLASLHCNCHETPDTFIEIPGTFIKLYNDDDDDKKNMMMMTDRFQKDEIFKSLINQMVF